MVNPAAQVFDVDRLDPHRRAGAVEFGPQRGERRHFQHPPIAPPWR
jgi:hypothetical protein